MKASEIISSIKTELISMEADAKKFEEKGNAAAGTRVRKDAMEIMKLCKRIRAGVQEQKGAKA